MKTMLCALLLLVTAATVQAAPQINVGNLYDYLSGERSTLLKRIRNSGDTTAFVKVSVFELVYDAQGTITEVAQDDLPLEQRPLIASPARLIVPASGMQTMRVLYRGERDKERYFRLRFVPVVPERGDGFAISEEDAQQYEALKAKVEILTGFGSLLFVHPSGTQYQTEVSSETQRFIVHNRGSSTVVLDHFNDCDASGKQCSVATKHHIRPGSDREFSRDSGRIYRFELIEGNERRRVEIKG
ncbi:fimbrial biogenesis chaperone [Pseudomonas huaxiensis]|uniref:molecular chaperone n=1 Tax=Pseudomonas huaxiensis TaxID=2213017 RepID=UPI000DA6610F|nr:molecular chaperone [Pseudomonas huaxiensis]